MKCCQRVGSLARCVLNKFAKLRIGNVGPVPSVFERFNLSSILVLDRAVFVEDDRVIAVRIKRRIEVNLKYIDPSYTIRSVPASAQDNVYCLRLAQNAVHAAMAGKTGMLIGQWHSTFVHIPFELVTQGRRRVDPSGDLWQAVLECTGQAVRMS